MELPLGRAVIMDPRAEAVRTRLTPPMRIVGEEIRWNMADRLAHYGCPAVSVAVLEEGQIAWAEAFGSMEEGQSAKPDAESLFSGASISKPVTAALALQFVEQGVFDLDVNVNRYLTAWQLPENEFTDAQPVTLRTLLSHTAGTTVHGFGGFPPGEALPTLVDVLEGRPPAKTKPVRVDKRPGLSTRYSGGGTTIVQLMLEEAFGGSFPDLAHQRLFEPLGMTRSTFENPLPERWRDNAAVGHEDGAILPGKWVCVPQLGAGGIWTTPSDYARFMAACRDAWLGRTTPLFGRAIATQMMTSQGGEFGLGWELFDHGGQIVFGHGGSNHGYQCESKCYLQSGDGAVVMTNADSGLIFYWEVFAAVAQVHGWRNFLADPKTVVPIAAEDLGRYAGVYDIISGVEMPEMKIWVEDGALVTHIEGMRAGPSRPLMDQNGRLFNRNRPSETEVIYGPDGRAQELVIRAFGTTEIMRMRRRPGSDAPEPAA